MTKAAAEFCFDAAETIGARNPQYGGPEEAFFRIGLIWNAFLELSPAPLGPVEVGKMLQLMKIVRSNTENDLVDAVGYAACTAEVAAKELHDFEPDAEEYEDFGDVCDFAERKRHCDGSCCVLDSADEHNYCHVCGDKLR